MFLAWSVCMTFWIDLGDTCIRIWGGISSVIWSKILFYGDAILNMVIPILMQVLAFIHQRHSILHQM